MTVETSISKSGPYAGAGTTGPFTVNFRFLDQTHLRVIRTDNTGEHVLTLTTDYTVAGTGNPTGSVTLVAALPVGQTLTIIRNVPKTQEADYVQNDDFPAESHENALDKLTMITQQINEVVDRTVTFPASDSASATAELPIASIRANNLLGFDATGKPVAIVPSAQSAAALQALLATDAGASLIGRNTQVVDSVSVLRTLSKTSPSKYAQTTGYYAPGDGGHGLYWLDVSDTTSIDNGSTTIVAADGGRWKLILLDDITLRQFGAKGDDSANDSTAILSAQVYMIATGRNVKVTPGTYLSDPFSLAPSSYGSQGNFYGEDRERTIFKRRTAGAGDFVTIGSSTGTIFQSGLVFRGMTFDGGVTTNGDAFVAYDMVRSRLENCAFTGGRYAVRMYGGISVTFEGCLFNNAKRGFQAQKFTSLAGGGWPNIIRINNSEVVDNTEFGVWFDNGRMLILDNTEVEGNGTTLAAAEGGIYIGPNIGEEVLGSDTFSIGLIARGCWLEANKGIADIRMDSGVNAIYDSNFFSTVAQTTNDVRIDGGRYDLKNVNMSFSKVANVLENAGVQIGNNIETSEIPNISVNSSKTTIYGANKITTRGGVVPIYQGLNVPVIVPGNSNTAAGAIVTINFGITFASVPKVFTQVHNGDSTTSILQIVVSNITTTGFDARCLSITSGSSTISSVLAGFNWKAEGTL